MRISDWSSDVCSSDLKMRAFWRQGGADTPLGAVLAIAVLLTMCGTFYNFGRWQRSNRRGWPTVACATLLGLVLALYAIAHTSPESAASDGTTFSPAALAEVRATGKPVFVYFTADWGLSCKANEAGAIERAADRKSTRLNSSH